MKVKRLDAGDYELQFVSTGNTLIVYHGNIIGMDLLKEKQPILLTYIPVGSNDGINVRDLTKEECMELADHMLCKWLDFKNEVEKDLKNVASD